MQCASLSAHAFVENLNCIELNGKMPLGKQEITIVTHIETDTQGRFLDGFLNINQGAKIIVRQEFSYI